MLNNKILIVEDDELAIVYLKESLEDCGFIVDVVLTITDAISTINFTKYDLILLDLNLPDYSGMELLKKLNIDKIMIPVIIISAYSDIDIKLHAYKLGAYDYLTKPINLQELEAKIWVYLKTTSQQIPKSQKNSNVFRIVENNIIFKDNILKLTKIEFSILSILIKNKNNIVSRKVLSKELASKSNESTINYHINNIRKKLDDNGSVPIYLVTEYGAGYKLIS